MSVIFWKKLVFPVTENSFYKIFSLLTVHMWCPKELRVYFLFFIFIIQYQLEFRGYNETTHL